jgi:hypothetical protein
MKIVKTLFSMLMLMLVSVSLFGQTNTGTLKIFSEEAVVVFVDQIQQPNYDAITLIAGTHYVKVMNKNEEKVYGQIVTIETGKITSVLIETPNVENPIKMIIDTHKGTGTLNIFSEFTGTSIYVDDKGQGNDIKVIEGVPIGNHYLRVIKDGVSIFAELITITEGQTTTVLIKNSGQVAEKIMEGKAKERQEYQISKVTVLYAPKSITTTQTKSSYYPGYFDYGYYGRSNTVSSTSEIADFKIIRGGIKEIGDVTLAGLVNNQAVLEANARDNVKVKGLQNVGAPMLLVGVLGGLLFGTDMFLSAIDEKSFLHHGEVPTWEWVATGSCIVIGSVGYGLIDASGNVYPHHYYGIDGAARDAQLYNNKLKEGLGLPESYDVK